MVNVDRTASCGWTATAMIVLLLDGTGLSARREAEVRLREALHQGRELNEKIVRRKSVKHESCVRLSRCVRRSPIRS